MSKEKCITQQDFTKEYKISEEEFAEIQEKCNDFFEGKPESVKYYQSDEELCVEIVYMYESQDLIKRATFFIDKKNEFKNTTVCLSKYEITDKKNNVGCCMDYSAYRPGILADDDEYEVYFITDINVNGVHVVYYNDVCPIVYAKEHAQQRIDETVQLLKDVDFLSFIPDTNEIEIKREELSDEWYSKDKNYYRYPFEKAVLAELVGKKIGDDWEDFQVFSSETDMYKSKEENQISRELHFDVKFEEQENNSYTVTYFEMAGYHTKFYINDDEDFVKYKVDVIKVMDEEKYKVRMTFEQFCAEYTFDVAETQMEKLIALADEILQKMIANEFTSLENGMGEFIEPINQEED